MNMSQKIMGALVLLLWFQQGIEKRKWDLIICEEFSRLFRSISPCMNLVGTAVDNEIRIICINDRVDTANDDWQHRLEDAQKDDGQDNYLTRYRIKRTQDERWGRFAWDTSGI